MSTFAYDFVGPPEERQRAALQVRETWAHAYRAKPDSTGAEILISPDGALVSDRFAEFLRARDDHPMNLQE